MKSNLVKIQKGQRPILRAIFLGEKFELLGNVLSENKILTVFELYVVQVSKILFKHLRYEKPTHYLQENF